MKLVFTMFLSIGVKALAAIIEILIQILLTNSVGIAGYGDYTFLVSVIEGVYYFLFSGSIKINTFYLSIPSLKLTHFKKTYIIYYAVPTFVAILGALTVAKGVYGFISTIILIAYFLAYDRSSIFFSRGCQWQALLGEYVVGRLAMLSGLMVCLKIGGINGLVLLTLYGIQFLAMLVWFIPFGKNLKPGEEEVEVPLKKIWNFQQSDIAYAFVNYSPTILQYIFGGAFSAGFIGIIVLVKKFLNFISGPMAKIFLPEFSRLYLAGKKEEIRRSYLMIVRIQMLFISTIGAALIGFPHLILRLFSAELLPYVGTFTTVAACLLMIAGIGPIGGILQMSNQERKCSINQWISIGVMVCIWFIMYQNPFFVLYGLCVQTIVENILHYYSVMKWFRKSLLSLCDYILMWFPVLLESIVVKFLDLQYSLVALIVSMTLVWIWNLFFALKDEFVKEIILKELRKMGRK